ncbi:hypothetical protein [Sphingomonas sp.]|uniref:hypothetical protein n=1 Tax=Sphingomonas sp. TaxID=28214 RepID=UPI002E3443AF|nr:hypothetical protein [Sphingomonas sp.]HEX4694051.1 hypothetical protein [Sphingomonas sp.]
MSDNAWTLAAAPNGAFVVETPCAQADIISLRRVPDSAIANVTFAPDSRVICRRGKIMLLAGEVDLPAVPAAGRSFFDQFVESIKGDETAEGTPAATTINGHRAFTNRQVANGVVAQTGFVELSRSKIIMLLAGAEENSGMSVAEQGMIVDRFYASVKVVRK